MIILHLNHFIAALQTINCRIGVDGTNMNLVVYRMLLTSSEFLNSSILVSCSYTLALYPLLFFSRKILI